MGLFLNVQSEEVQQHIILYYHTKNSSSIIEGDVYLLLQRSETKEPRILGVGYKVLHVTLLKSQIISFSCSRLIEYNLR